MAQISVSEYVDICIQREISEYMEIRKTNKIDKWQEDQMMEYRETLTKNVQNLLKEFNGYTNEFDVDKKNIFSYFPLKSLEKEEQIKFLDHIMELKSEKNIIGNKVVHNIKKITYDLNDSRFDALNIKDYKDYELTKEENNIKKANREIIRRNIRDISQLFVNIEKATKCVRKNNTDLFSYLNIINDIMIQSLIYWVVTIEHLVDDEREMWLKKIETHISYFMQTGDKEVKNTKLDDDILVFITFLKYRNKYGEHYKTMKIFLEEQEKEQSLFENISNEYKVSKDILVNGQDLKLILNEGRHRCDNFEEKLEQTKVMISFFKDINSRVVSEECVLDLKVYFREFFISKSKYKTTALNMIKKHLQGEKEMTFSEQVFLNEKISRGYFRESLPIKFYNYKSEIQRKVYLAQIKLLLTYDIDEIITKSENLCIDIINLNYQNIKERLG